MATMRVSSNELNALCSAAVASLKSQIIIAEGAEPVSTWGLSRVDLLNQSLMAISRLSQVAGLAEKTPSKHLKEIALDADEVETLRAAIFDDNG
jgi:hypothetical protein